MNSLNSKNRKVEFNSKYIKTRVISNPPDSKILRNSEEPEMIAASFFLLNVMFHPVAVSTLS